MIGLKQVDQLSLEECFDILVHQKGHSLYEEVNSRYVTLVSGLTLAESYAFLERHQDEEEDPSRQMVEEHYMEHIQRCLTQEERDFQACKTIEDYSGFIDKYKSLAPAYMAKHLDHALLKIAHIKKEQELKHRSDAQKIHKRKKRNLLIGVGGFLVVVALAFFLGYKPVKTLEAEDVSFGKEGGAKTLRFSTNVSSNAVEIEKPDETWIDVDCSGNVARLVAKPNPDPKRSCMMRIRAYSTFYGWHVGVSKQTTVKIDQSSGYATVLEVSNTKINVEKNGGSQQLILKTDGVKLDLHSDAGWIKWTCVGEKHDEEYYHNDTYSVAFDVNPTADRTGIITVETGGRSQEIVVTQSSGLANVFDISRSSIGPVDRSGSEEGRYYRVYVTTDGTTWDVTTYYDWLQVSKYSDYFNIVVRPNYGEVRTGYVHASSNNNHHETITINQDGNPSSFYVAHSSWTFDTSSDYDYISFTNNSWMDVNVSTDKSWLSASISGSSVKISCESNSSSSRNGTVTLACGDKKATISVHQKGWVYSSCPRCWNGYFSSGVVMGIIGYNYWGAPQYGTVQCPDCGGTGQIRHKDY